MNIAQKPRWRRKGTKLHIYNDHTFIAKHLPRWAVLEVAEMESFNKHSSQSSSGLICEICMQSIPFRMGKQGYECRDCFLKCHKQCHVRTPQLCPKPTIQSIELWVWVHGRFSLIEDWRKYFALQIEVMMTGSMSLMSLFIIFVFLICFIFSFSFFLSSAVQGAQYQSSKNIKAPLWF